MTMSNKREPQKKQVFTPLKLFHLMESILTDEEVFYDAVNRIKLEHFSSQEQAFAAIWDVALDYMSKHAEMPTVVEISGVISGRVEADPNYLTDDEIEEVNQLFDRVEAAEKAGKRLKTAAGRNLLQQFITDRFYRQISDHAVNADIDPEQLPEIAESWVEQANLVYLDGTSRISAPYDQGWDKGPPLEVIPTRVNIFDKFLRGGVAGGEVYTLMGPYGSCKTTLGVQLSIGLSNYYFDQWRRNGRNSPLGVVYLLSYESSNLLEVRGLSHAAQLPRSILERKKYNQLSRPQLLNDRDRTRYALKLEKGARIYTEVERKAMWEKRLAWNWRPVDMSGTDPNAPPTRGTGMFTEAAALIRNDIKAMRKAGLNRFCGAILFDYVGAMVLRSPQGESDENRRRRMIGHAAYRAKEVLGRWFKQCPIFLLHQLSATANSLPPGVMPHHNQAAEAKNFAENADFSFVVGSPDEENLCLIACTKHRRAPALPFQIVQIDGEYSTVREVQGYRVDPKRKRIVLSDELAMNEMAQEDRADADSLQLVLEDDID